MNYETEFKVAYLAGVMDSDGYFTIHRGTSQCAVPIYSPDLGINQAEPQAIYLARDVFGGAVKIVDYSKYSDRFSRRPMYAWHCPKGEQIEVLNLLIPYLRIKREQAMILLRLRRDIDFYPRTGGREKFSLPLEATEYREKLYQELKGLRHPPVAETERESSSLEEMRQSDLNGNIESVAEMTAPTK